MNIRVIDIKTETQLVYTITEINSDVMTIKSWFFITQLSNTPVRVILHKHKQLFFKLKIYAFIENISC